MNGEVLRFVFFLIILLGALLLEYKFSYQRRNLLRMKRWPANFLLIISASIILFVLKINGGFSKFYHHIGLLQLIDLPAYIEIILSLVMLDFFIYLQHVFTHKIPFLWRFHSIHHSDVDLDASSALRFHPVEIVGSFFYKMGLVFIVGFKLETLIVFEIILSSMAIFNHSNIYIPERIEKLLRIFIVTPQMHLVHHSIHRNESDTNYGFNLSCWDYLFRTYKCEMRDSSVIGQKLNRTANDHKFLALLVRPFLRSRSE
jgi:sterol desaturase/sphingolipid hydroxylase (fatty acid hydroxylase superfamily)